jgi:hypothetical protein
VIVARVGRNNRRALRRTSLVRSRHSGFIPTRPVSWVAHLNQPMKSRIRPVHDTLDQTMFQRIDMHIIHVRLKIHLIANQMLPIPPLPYPPLSTRPRAPSIYARTGQSFGKAHLDQAPARCKIRITRRQPDHAMEVIRQDHPGMNPEWMTMPNQADDFAQHINLSASHRRDG